MDNTVKISRYDALFIYFMLYDMFKSNIMLYRTKKNKQFYYEAKICYHTLQAFKIVAFRKWLP